MPKILLVEDDKDLLDQLDQFLSHERYEVETVTDGQEAADRLKLYQYDVVVLDWNLPSRSGLEVCKEYRDRSGVAKVLMLTGKGDVSEKEAGLDAGADDYLTKPFHLLELGARVRALLRRPSKILSSKLTAGALELDPQTHTATTNGKPLELLPKEFSMLEFFMKNPNEVFSQEALLDRIWNSESDSSVSTVYTHVKTLRKKLAAAGCDELIKTVHGLGYKLSLPSEK